MLVYTSVSVFLFSALALIVPSGFSVGATLLLAGSLALFGRRPAPAMDRDDRLIIAVLASYFIVSVIANLTHDAPLREYDAPLRFLLAVPALLLLRACPPRPAFLWAGLAIGAIGAGAYSGWQHLVLGMVRASGDTNPIQYGYISMILGILCLAGIRWAVLQRHPRVWTAVLLGASLMGILGAIFTGSRSSWLPVPLALLVLYVSYGKTLGQRYAVLGLVLALGAGAAVYGSTDTDVKARVQDAISETRAYFQSRQVKSDDASTSVGARFEMWRMGLMMFPVHPWSGWGKQGYMQHAAQLAKAGVVNPVVTLHSHLHNDYLDALVKRGIPGLLATLALYLIPFRLFVRRFRHARPPAQAYAIGGILLSVCYFGFGLTDAFLTHNDGVMVYAFMLVIFWSMLRHPEQA